MTLRNKIVALSALPLVVLMAACTQNESAANDSGVNYVKKDGAAANVVAKYDGKDITVDQLEKMSPDVFGARLDVYKAQKNALEDYVRNQVIEGLAKKAGKSTEEFMKGEMESAKKKVSDKEVEAFLKSKNVPDTSKVPPEVKDQVRGLLHVQKLVASATKSSPVEIYLKRPKAEPIAFQNMDKEPSWGNADAPVTIVEFADFQCYYCGQARSRITELKKMYGKKLRLVYKNYPLPAHPDARPAAEAAMCVNEQGSDKFWKYSDIMMDNQQALQADKLKEYAKKVGVNEKQFDDCVAAKKYSAQIDASIAEGQKLGVNSTPSFFVNSQLVKGAQPVSEFKEIIDEVVQ